MFVPVAIGLLGMTVLRDRPVHFIILAIGGIGLSCLLF